MCGRFTLGLASDIVENEFNVDLSSVDYRPRYNIAPGQAVPVITKAGRQYQAELMRWGLVPHWAKTATGAAKMINARAETVTQKPSFRKAFQQQRCLIPADGFYEWREAAGRKMPYRIVLPDHPVFAFAGIWDTLPLPEGARLITFSIITTNANAQMAAIHPRMPVILTKAQQAEWLNPLKTTDLPNLLRSYPGELTIFPVAPAVNNPRNDTSECIKPLTQEVDKMESKQGCLF